MRERKKTTVEWCCLEFAAEGGVRPIQIESAVSESGREGVVLK